MGVPEPAGQSPGQCGEQVKVAQEVQEAHRRGTTDPSQQPGPAYPSGTRHSFPTALSELVCTMREPRGPRCNPEIPPGEAGGEGDRPGLGVVPLLGGGGRTWRRGKEGLQFQSPMAPTLGNSQSEQEPGHVGQVKASGERKERVPQQEWTASTPHVTQLFQRMGGRTRRKQQTHTLFI